MSAIEATGKVTGLVVGGIYLWTTYENDYLSWGWFILVMATVGIPHGAIDHLMYQNKSKNNGLLSFLFLYLGIMLSYLLIWAYLPVLSLVLFLVMSAYHFGQTHFIQIKVERNKTLLYLSTGSFYLAVILFGDIKQTIEILKPLVDIQALSFYGPWVIIIFFLLTSIFILLLKSEKIISHLLELVVLGLFLYNLPLLLAFITYFGFWHALPSLLEEYKKLDLGITKNKFLLFLRYLLPFSIISLTGIALVLIISNKWLSEREITLLFFVMVSLISAPHIWIMNRFLEKTKAQN